MKKAETRIVKGCLDALAISGFWAWRVNSGSLFIAGRAFRGAPNGTPDIMVILPGSRVGFLEVKTATGEERDTQIEWQERADKLGVRWAVVRAPREAVAAVMAWRIAFATDELTIASVKANAAERLVMKAKGKN